VELSNLSNILGYFTIVPEAATWLLDSKLRRPFRLAITGAWEPPYQRLSKFKWKPRKTDPLS
jgi:hypothetical protein